MRVQVRCFASVREAVGQSRLDVEVPAGATLADVVDAVVDAAAAAGAQEAETLKAWRSAGHLRLALDRHHADPDTPVPDGAEVALFPPTSGG